MTKYSKEFNEAELDPGIRETVMLLRRHGFDTGDSGDGVSKPSDERTLHYPHVFATCHAGEVREETDRMARLLGSEWHVEGSYSPDDNGTASIGAYLREAWDRECADALAKHAAPQVDSQ